MSRHDDCCLIYERINESMETHVVIEENRAVRIASLLLRSSSRKKRGWKFAHACCLLCLIVSQPQVSASIGARLERHATFHTQNQHTRQLDEEYFSRISGMLLTLMSRVVRARVGSGARKRPSAESAKVLAIPRDIAQRLKLRIELKQNRKIKRIL